MQHPQHSRANKIAIVDRNIHPKGIEILQGFGLHIVFTTKILELDGVINTHPDMQILPTKKQTVLVAPQCYDYYFRQLGHFGINVIKFESNIFSPYPYDTPLNAAPLFDKYLFASSYTYNRLKKYFNNLQPVIVKQGYTKCSICPVYDNALITSDVGIYKASKNLGIDTLYVDPRHIKLSGFSNGLFGGLTGLIAPDTLFINGNLQNLSNYKSILAFLKKYNVLPVYSRDYDLCDIGSVIVL